MRSKLNPLRLNDVLARAPIVLDVDQHNHRTRFPRFALVCLVDKEPEQTRGQTKTARISFTHLSLFRQRYQHRYFSLVLPICIAVNVRHIALFELDSD
jgi:hypothetical protein